ncbi:MAG: hypothetical protein JHC33_01345 [Ignisphaera sp.]|nr:hypothetical protein [Ignisphaera sp.]
MAYDVNKMLSDGYSLSDIGNAMGYNVTKMKSDGYGDAQITSALQSYKGPSSAASSTPIAETKSTGSSTLDKMGAMQNSEFGKMVQDKTTPKEPVVNNITTGTDSVPQVSTISGDPQYNPDNYTGAFKQDVAQPLGEFTGQVAAGMATPVAGVQRAFDDATGINTGGQTNVNSLQSYEKTYNDQHPDQTIAPSTIGEGIDYFLTPMGKGMAAGMGSIMGITSAMGIGENKSYGEALTTGGISALAGGAVMKGLDMLSDTVGEATAAKVYNYLKDYNNISEDEATSIFSNWSKVMDATDNSANRSKAIVDYLGNKGASIKVNSVANSPKAIAETEGEMKARLTAVKDMTNGASPIEYTADSLNEASNIVKDNYNFVKSTIGNNPVSLDVTSDLTKALTSDTKAIKDTLLKNSNIESDITTAMEDAASGSNKLGRNATPVEIPESMVDAESSGSVQAIKSTLSSPSVTTQDIINIMPNINKLISRTDGVVKYNWGKVKDSLQTALEKSLNPNEFKAWTEANSDYSKMADVTYGKVGDVMTNVRKGIITPEVGIRQISKLKPGETLFSNLQDMVGSKATAGFEKSILKEAMGKNSETVDWAHLARNIDQHGFITPEGKAIKSAIDSISKSFLTDDSINAIIAKSNFSDSGIGSNIYERAKVKFIGSVFKALTKRIPFNETSKYELRMDQLSKILSSPTKVKSLMSEYNSLGEGIKQKFTDDLVKQIAYKPKSVPTGDVNLNPMYSTLKGTVSSDMSQVSLHDAQLQIVKESLGSSIKSDQVMNTIKSVLDGKRTANILKDVSERMKVNDREGNAKMLQTILSKEVNSLVSTINKSNGVKLHPDDVAKIYKLKLDKLMKDCNGL